MEKTKIPMDTLGFDAKVMAAAWFGMGMKGSVTLHLQETRPTERTQAALDELVDKGVISVEPFNELGGRVLRPLMDCHDAFVWMAGIRNDETMAAEARWQINESIDEDQAYDLMTPFGQGLWDKERRGRRLRENPYDETAAPDAYAQWRKGHRLGVKP